MYITFVITEATAECSIQLYPDCGFSKQDIVEGLNGNTIRGHDITMSIGSDGKLYSVNRRGTVQVIGKILHSYIDAKCANFKKA